MANAPDPTISLAEQAAWWWQVFQDGDVSAADHREFSDWIARSPEHVEAYLKTALLHRALKAPAVRWPDATREQLIRDSQAALPEPVTLQPSTDPASQRAKSRWSSPRLRFAMASAAAAFVAIIGIGISWTMLGQSKRYVSAVGEQRIVMLEDGTRVTLNTASKIEVRLRKSHRGVRLVQGEALFEVAHDARRPFDVNAGNATVRAVGTQFNVDTRPRQTTITVVEGRVAYVSGKVPVLEAGDRLVVTAAGEAMISHGVNVESALAWTRNQLVFERRPLGEVAEEFNRYNQERIVIESESLRAEEVTGIFQADNPASFVAFLSNIPDVVIRGDGAGGFVVNRKTP
jgi:transmembrane sensor